MIVENYRGKSGLLSSEDGGRNDLPATRVCFTIQFIHLIAAACALQPLYQDAYPMPRHTPQTQKTPDIFLVVHPYSPQAIKRRKSRDNPKKIAASTITGDHLLNVTPVS